MKLNVLFLLVFLFSFIAEARSVRVKGHYRKNGSYVQPHKRSSPDYSKSNNWSSKGNYNPYTGKAGTK